MLSPFAVLQVFSHVCPATAMGYANSRRTGTGHVHRVRTLSKASTDSTTTRYIRVFKTRVSRSSVGHEERPTPCAVQVVTSTVERWRRPSPTQLVAAMCGAFNAVLLQEAHDHVPHISDQLDAYSDDGDLAILLNKDTFQPDAVKYPIVEEFTSKTTWGLKALVVCGDLSRPPVGAPKTVTFCTVHLHNVVAKKCDAATSLFQRLYAYMKLLTSTLWAGLFQSCQRHYCRRVQRPRLHGTSHRTALGRWRPRRG